MDVKKTAPNDLGLDKPNQTSTRFIHQGWAVAVVQAALRPLPPVSPPYQELLLLGARHPFTLAR